MKWLLSGLVLVALGTVAPAQPPKREAPKYEFKKDHDPDGIGKFYMGREILYVLRCLGYRKVAEPVAVGEPQPPGIAD